MQRDGQTDQPRNGQIEIERQTYKWIKEGQTERVVYGRMDRRMDRQMDRRMDRWMDRWMDRRMDRRTDKGISSR